VPGKTPRWRQPTSERDAAPSARQSSRSELDAVSQGVVIREFEMDDTGITQRIQEDPDLALLYRKEENTRKKFADMLMEAMGEKPPEERLSSIEKAIRFWRWIIVAIAIPAATSAVLVGKYLIQKGADDERVKIESEQIQKKADDLETRLRAIEDTATRNSQRLDDFTRTHSLGAPSQTTPDKGAH
jgi:anti-sigma-K factor RskA